MRRRNLLVLALLGVALLRRTLRKNPIFVLLGAVLFDRRVRWLVVELLFALIKNRRVRRLILRKLFRR